MDRFGNRLRGTILSAGLNLSGAARLAGVSQDELQRWFALNVADVPAYRLAPICERARIKMQWLVTGRSTPQIVGTLTAADAEALAILSAIPPRKVKFWLGIGRRLSL